VRFGSCLGSSRGLLNPRANESESATVSVLYELEASDPLVVTFCPASLKKKDSEVVFISDELDTITVLSCDNTEAPRLERGLRVGLIFSVVA